VLLHIPFGLLAAVLGTIVGKGLYVLQDTKTVALIGVAETVIYLILCWKLIPLIGYLAVPIAYAYI